jgi:hypothetical protein
MGAASRAWVKRAAEAAHAAQQELAALTGQGPVVTLRHRCGMTYHVEAGYAVRVLPSGPRVAFFCPRCGTKLDIPEPIRHLQRGTS